MSMSVNNVLSTYTYTYQKQTRAILDKNNDSKWDKNEVASYAKDYKEATGVSLDVDKIMSTYAREDGYIHFNDWDQVYKDDALGFQALKDLAAKSGASSTAASTGASTSSTVDFSALSGYFYIADNKVQPRLDKDFDGMWNKQELTNYVGAYEKATGVKLDVDAILAKYGDENGKIGYAGQNKIRDDDALGFKKLTEAYLAQTKSASSTGDTVIVNPNEIKDNWFKTRETAASSASYDLSDIMAGMSSASRARFAVSLSKTDGMSALLNNFVSTNSVSGGVYNMYSAMSQLYTANYNNIISKYGGSAGSQSMYNQMMNILA